MSALIMSPASWMFQLVRSEARTDGLLFSSAPKRENEVWSKAIADGIFETKPTEEVKPGLGLGMKLAK